MLPTEFYLHNATTVLLWLFQMCSHDMLIFLILLGVVVVVFSFSILGFNVTRLAYSVVLAVVNLALRRILRNNLYNTNFESSNSFVPSFTTSLLRRIVSDSTTDSNTSSNPQQLLNLPQYLALPPAQRAAIEAVLHNPTVDIDNTVFNSLLDTTGQFTAAQRASISPISPRLRRSTRLRRPRNPCSL